MNQEKVSIITVSYNSARTLERTLQSVLDQSYGDIEYIVVDGGSTDGSRQLIERYADRLAWWVSEPDGGISAAFNKGLARATGSLVGLLNADDCYLPDSVAAAVQALQAQPQAGFVFGDQWFVDEQDRILFQQTGDPDYAASIACGMPSIPHPATFVRAEVYRRYGGFDETYRTAMDYELLLRFHRAGVKGCYLPRPLARMRLGGESDRNYVRAYAEVRDISVRYGLPAWQAQGLYVWRVLKTFTRRRLEQCGLVGVVRGFRTLVGRRYRYDR